MLTAGSLLCFKSAAVVFYLHPHWIFQMEPEQRLLYPGMFHHIVERFLRDAEQASLFGRAQ